MKITDRTFLKTPTPSVHAATIAFFEDEPCFSWFGGSREGASDVAIYYQRGLDNDSLGTWGSNDNAPRWNPVLFTHDNKLFLFAKLGTFCDRWQTVLFDVTSATDEYSFGKCTTSMNIIPAGLNGPVKTKPIIIGDTVYCGSSVETVIDWASYIEKFNYTGGENSKFDFIHRSVPLVVPKRIIETRKGASYSKGIIQPSLWYDEDGSILHSFFRSSTGLGSIYHAWSDLEYDEEIWTEPKPTSLPNPNSGMDTVLIGDRLFVCSNPSATHRWPLVVDEISMLEYYETGEFNVKDTLVITEELEKTYTNRELSYPYMVENNGKLHIVYTHCRKQIEYVEVEV